MPRPYSTKTKREAALICDIAASNPLENVFDIAAALGIRGSSMSIKLALAAENAAYNALVADGTAHTFAEASGLIRNGWRIGEKTVLFMRLYDSTQSEPEQPESPLAPSMHDLDAGEGAKSAVLEPEDPPAPSLLSQLEEAEDGATLYEYPTEPSPEGEPGEYGSDS